ncbi:MAG TPA: ribonuclease HII, partial [Candidatus Bathyarchaeota archaeon]|nr:ribonuclease HII [Candidatus Bathyarchaeota archaeon]
CVIGPMAVAGVLVDEEGLEELREVGVRNSKELEPMRREELAEEIVAISLAHVVVLIQPRQLDMAVMRGALNKLEAKVMASIINALRPDVAYIDASDVIEARFANMVRSCCSLGYGLRLVAEHKADAKYPVVAAASILAKVERDKAIRAIKEDLRVDFGSGYPSDPRTLSFLEDWCSKHGSLPDCVRRSWKTVRELLARVRTPKLDAWAEAEGKRRGGGSGR